ncbi:MAG: hypothetical protein Ta2B_05340 [Termitinemataceae bacterium]|nr:MAG: hypothetical protein Ta2B_05340 [Termitinemataceae bacterium]
MKLNKYMNDPEIIHEPQAMREIHAIRLQIHNERCGLTSAEYNELVHKNAQAFLAEPIKKELIGLTANELADLAEPL